MFFKHRSQSVSARVDTILELDGLESFRKLLAENPQFVDPKYIEGLAKSVFDAGAREPLTGLAIPPRKIEAMDNLREGMVYQSINSRMRAVMLCIQQALANQNRYISKIYATEAITPFALRMRSLFPKFIGSEYAETKTQREDLFPIPCEDLLRLTLPTNTFDLVTTNEVLEHVPSVDGALGEIYRVLKPGGWHIGTIPFAYGQNESVVKAKLEKGKVRLLTEPEYHGNPVDKRGSLVFEIPGWDILDRARAIGFKEALVKYVISTEYACLSNGAGGIFVFCFQK